MTKATGIDEAVQSYLDSHRTPDDALLQELRAETQTRFTRLAGMQVSASQGTLLRMLVRSIGARRAIEIGTFTGYSSLQIARGLVPGGRLIACDLSEQWTGLARTYWERAGVADCIDLRIGPAADTLRALPLDDPFDFAFIDADKANYALYYEELLPRLRPNGLLAVDNALWGGKVLDPNDQSADTLAIRALNDRIAADERVECTLLAVADGLMLARKRD